MNKKSKVALIGAGVGFFCSFLFQISIIPSLEYFDWRWVFMVGLITCPLCAIIAVLIAGNEKANEEKIDAFAEIEKIKKLHDMGAITDEEFNEQKKKLLNS